MQTLSELRKLENEARLRLESAEREYIAAKAGLMLAKLRTANHKDYRPPTPQPFLAGKIHGLPRDLRPAKRIEQRQIKLTGIDLSDFR